MDNSELQNFSKVYDSLWQDAVDYYARGNVQIDPHLLDLQNDQRRGLTIILRPSQEIIQQFSRLVETLKRIDSEQYYYFPDQFHVTVLTLVTAKGNPYPFFEKIPEYRKVLKSVFSNQQHFQIFFKGVTASPSSLMVQGFTPNGLLNQLREQLRDALHKSGLSEDLDTRYRMQTAHSTIMRFQKQPQNLQLLIDTLTHFREYDFGLTNIRTLQWVKNDWYMSPKNLEVLEEYYLKPNLQS